MKRRNTEKLNWNPEEHSMFQEERPQNDIEKEQAEDAPVRRNPTQCEKKRIQRKKKKRKKKHYILKLLFLVAIGIGIYAFAHSDTFLIEKIEVSESSRFQAEQLQELCGLKTGINLFEFRTGDCEEKLLENPYIKEAKISRKLPGTVKVKLTERQEAATLLEKGLYIVIDEEGIVLRRIEKQPRIPLLEGITVKEAEENHVVQVKEPKRLETGMMLLEKMEAADLYFKKIDVSGTPVKAFLMDKLLCEGKTKNLVAGMEDGDLKAIIYDLYQKKIKKGTIYVGNEKYYAFSKKVE